MKMEVTISPILLAIIVAMTLMFSGTIYILLKKNTNLESSNTELLNNKTYLINQNEAKTKRIATLSTELTVIKKDFKESTEKWVKEEKYYNEEIDKRTKAAIELQNGIDDYLVTIKNVENSLKDSNNNYNSLHKRYELLELQKVKLDEATIKLNKDIDILEDKCKEKDSIIDNVTLKVKSLSESCDNYVQDIKQYKKELSSAKGSNTKLKTSLERLKKSSK